jgi:uncharacterized protein DUF1918
MAASEDLKAGTVIIVYSAGGARRAGEILEVLGEPGHHRFRMRWDDDHESIFFPGPGVTIERFGRPHARASAKR